MRSSTSESLSDIVSDQETALSLHAAKLTEPLTFFDFLGDDFEWVCNSLESCN